MGIDQDGLTDVREPQVPHDLDVVRMVGDDDDVAWALPEDLVSDLAFGVLWPRPDHVSSATACARTGSGKPFNAISPRSTNRGSAQSSSRSGTKGVFSLLAYDPCIRRVYQPAALP
jgi:hypothetical protein